MFAFLQKLLRRPSQRPARTLALYGPRNDGLNLLAGLDWILEWATKLGLPEAEWVTWNYGEPGNRQYKTYSLSSWMKQGRPLPAGCSSVEISRDEGRQGLHAFGWYACLANEPSFTLCTDIKVCSPLQSAIEGLVKDIQEITRVEYGYGFEMAMEKGPVIYVNGGTLNGRKFFSQSRLEEIAKWSHAIGECRKLGLPLSDFFRDIYPLNFINPHHLAMQIKGQSLKDWIKGDPKRGSLRPLIDDRLWVWQVPENRIASIRKVLGPQRLLVSWGDFNTPSGGPLGHTYGPQRGKQKPVEFPYPHRPVTETERKQIDNYLQYAANVFEHYSGERYGRARKTRLIFKLLDLAFEAWTKDPNPDKFPAERVAEAFGAALGQALADRLGMEWAHVDDNGWVEAVVHFKSHTIAYPFDSVAKRVEAGEYGFIQGIYHAVQEQMRQG